MVSGERTNASVSVIIPMYNAARFVTETLESVRGQTYKDWELIIVDDGSTDSSVERVQEFLSLHPCRAQLLSHQHGENRGTSASRNLGLENAKGEYVSFLDADDVWNPDFLEFFTGAFSHHPEISMAYGPALLWHTEDAGRDQTADTLQNLGTKADRIVDALTLFRLFLDGDGDTPAPSGVILRREVLCAVGGWEESFRGMYDDQVLYSKLFLRGIGVYVTSRCLYRYRQHRESICTSAALQEAETLQYRKTYLEWLRRYLELGEKKSEDCRIMLTEHLWHIQFHRENEGLTPGGWRRRISRIRSLLALLAEQKNVSFMLKLGLRIVGRQVWYSVRSIRDRGKRTQCRAWE